MRHTRLVEKTNRGLVMRHTRLVEKTNRGLVMVGDFARNEQI